MNTPTPETDEIIRELEGKLQESSEAQCNCGSIAIEHGCPACSKYTSAVNTATKAIAKLESERDEARAIIAAAIPWMVKGEENGAWKHTCLPKAGSKVLQQMRDFLKDVKPIEGNQSQ